MSEASDLYIYPYSFSSWHLTASVCISNNARNSRWEIFLHRNLLCRIWDLLWSTINHSIFIQLTWNLVCMFIIVCKFWHFDFVIYNLIRTGLISFLHHVRLKLGIWLRYLFPKHMKDKLVWPKSQKTPIYKKILIVYIRNYICNKQIGWGKLILQHQNINCCQLTEILDFW